MRLLPPQTHNSITPYSALSRNDIAKLFSQLSQSRVNASTITKLCDLIGFPCSLPIPLKQVQRVYLLACAKELINTRSSYREAMHTCKLALTDNPDHLIAVWGLVQKSGGLSQADFDQALTKFYLQMQAKKTSAFQ